MDKETHSRKKCEECEVEYCEYQKQKHEILECQLCKKKYCVSKKFNHEAQTCKVCKKQYCCSMQNSHFLLCKYCSQEYCVSQDMAHKYSGICIHCGKEYCSNGKDLIHSEEICSCCDTYHCRQISHEISRCAYCGEKWCESQKRNKKDIGNHEPIIECNHCIKKYCIKQKGLHGIKCQNCEKIYCKMQINGNEEHKQTICGCCNKKFCNIQKSDHNLYCHLCKCTFCLSQNKKHSAEICAVCNVKHCVQQENLHKLKTHNDSTKLYCKQPYNCRNVEDGCEYTLPQNLAIEMKNVLMFLHIKYSCHKDKTIRESCEYQYCYFREMGCDFSVGLIESEKESRIKMANHLENECPFYPIKCTNKGCDQYYDRQYFENHVKSCIKTTCPKCGELIQESFDIHYKYHCIKTKCGYKGCTFCSTDENELAKHRLECKIELCEFCGKFVYNLEYHINNECKKIHCKYMYFGCEFFSCNSEKLAAHIRDCSCNNFTSN